MNTFSHRHWYADNNEGKPTFGRAKPQRSRTLITNRTTGKPATKNEIRTDYDAVEKQYKKFLADPNSFNKDDQFNIGADAYESVTKLSITEAEADRILAIDMRDFEKELSQHYKGSFQFLF